MDQQITWGKKAWSPLIFAIFSCCHYCCKLWNKIWKNKKWNIKTHNKIILPKFDLNEAENAKLEVSGTADMPTLLRKLQILSLFITHLLLSEVQTSKAPLTDTSPKPSQASISQISNFFSHPAAAVKNFAVAMWRIGDPALLIDWENYLSSSQLSIATKNL
jgi:hypothetical protein